MHDMVAVMLLMDPQPPLNKIFLLFSMFLQTFLPYVFDDRDCMFLQHLFEMIRLLLQYHDPRRVPSPLRCRALPLSPSTQHHPIDLLSLLATHSLRP